MNGKEWHLKANPRRKRPNRAWIHNDTYDFGCYVLWPVDDEQLKIEYLHINKDSEYDEDADFSISSGKFVTSNDICCIAFKKELPPIGVIAHEAFHLTCHVFDERGIKPDLDNDEPQAYLLEWVVDRIYNLTRGAK